MKLNNVWLAVFCALAIGSCKKDDEGETFVSEKLSDVVVEDEATIQAYLETHFYNYEDFENPPANFNNKIILDTIAGVNADKTPLSDQVTAATVSVSSENFGLEDGETIEHTYYYVVAREGGGDLAKATDSVYLKYQGELLTGVSFDATPSYLWQYLPFTIRGYSEGVSKLRTGSEIIVNSDGTTSIADSGIGLIIMPSGMGYFNTGGSTGALPLYAPLLFKLEAALYVPDTDYDGDGIPSYMEDLNGDGNLNNDNTDAAAEVKAFSAAFANHNDPDDDNDGIPTREEIVIDENGVITFPDTDGDGVPDYLDADS